MEDDLARRDLTINAMAPSDNEDLIELFGGRKDLSERVLRHVGPAFAEAPLRVLRVARFTAEIEFGVSLAFMRELAPQLLQLPRERIWNEPTEGLDSNTQSEMLTALDAIAAGKSVILISHRAREEACGP